MKTSKVPSCCSASRNSLGKGRKGKQQKSNLSPSIKNMVKLDTSLFLMGTDDANGSPEDGEGPVRKILLDSFYIDSTTVTNAEFKRFIDDTTYQTDAKKYGWSFVFYMLLPKSVWATQAKVAESAPWWCAIPEANWKHPEGQESNLKDRMNHPVVHISWNDASAYCQWADKRLPTEAEWEFSARGGLKQKRFPWGDKLTPNDEHRCNIWQGQFPKHNTILWRTVI